jgi:hypothetical protein
MKFNNYFKNECNICLEDNIKVIKCDECNFHICYECYKNMLYTYKSGPVMIITIKCGFCREPYGTTLDNKFFKNNKYKKEDYTNLLIKITNEEYLNDSLFSDSDY